MKYWLMYLVHYLNNNRAERPFFVEVTMLDFQQRVVDEAKELEVKVIALFSFIRGKVFPSIDNQEQTLLSAQYEAMRAYLAILKARIERF